MEELSHGDHEQLDRQSHVRPNFTSISVRKVKPDSALYFEDWRLDCRWLMQAAQPHLTEYSEL